MLERMEVFRKACEELGKNWNGLGKVERVPIELGLVGKSLESV